MESTAQTGQSILIVDDDTAIRELYETFFQSAGYKTITARDGEEGLQMAREHHPTVILLDVMMPRMDGREMLKQVKADPTIQNIPVIIFSALITELEKEESLANGASEYIEKSDVEDPDQLLEKIKQIIGGTAPA